MPSMIDLSEFHPKMMDDEDTALLVGKRKTGKTTALKALAYNKRHIPGGVAFCGSKGSYEAFSQIIPETYIFEEWDAAVAQRVINQTQRANYERKRQGLPKKFHFCYMDDCGWDPKFCTNQQLKRMLMNGRNDGVSPIYVAVQDALNFRPAVRNQFDWVFIFREIIPNNRKRLYEHYGGQLGDYKLFCDVLDATTNDHGCLVIRNSGTSNRIQDNFFWWKAPLRDWQQNLKQKRWHCGSRSYWMYHFKCYDLKWREKQMGYDDSEEIKKEQRKKKNVKLRKGVQR